MSVALLRAFLFKQMQRLEDEQRRIEKLLSLTDHQPAPRPSVAEVLARVPQATDRRGRLLLQRKSDWVAAMRLLAEHGLLESNAYNRFIEMLREAGIAEGSIPRRSTLCEASARLGNNLRRFPAWRCPPEMCKSLFERLCKLAQFVREALLLP